MGDWEDTFGSAGMSEDFSPWDSPCWNDDWEQEILQNFEFRTASEWNLSGRIVKKGENGIKLPCARKVLFEKSQTIPSKYKRAKFKPGWYGKLDRNSLIMLESCTNEELKEAEEHYNQSLKEEEITEKNNSKKLDEIIKWISTSDLSCGLKKNIAFSISKGVKVRLKNLEIVDLYDWLLKEGVNTNRKMYKYFMRKISDKLYLTRIEDIGCKSVEFIKSGCKPDIDEATEKTITYELSKYSCLTKDQKKIIKHTDCILAWEDVDTGLVWDAAMLFTSNCKNVSYNMHYILNNFNYAGFNDWRIPTLSELRTIVNNENNNGSFIKQPLLETSGRYWAKQEGKYTDDRHVIDLNNGIIETDMYYKDDPSPWAYTRCVRGKNNQE